MFTFKTTGRTWFDDVDRLHMDPVGGTYRELFAAIFKQVIRPDANALYDFAFEVELWCDADGNVKVNVRNTGPVAPPVAEVYVPPMSREEIERNAVQQAAAAVEADALQARVDAAVAARVDEAVSAALEGQAKRSAISGWLKGND